MGERGFFSHSLKRTSDECCHSFPYEVQKWKCDQARRKRIIFGITKGNGKITHVQNGKYPATIPGKKGSVQVQVHIITLSEMWREWSKK